MNKKGLSLGGTIILFIGIIFSLALLPAIFQSQNVMTDKQSVVNESNNLATSCITGSDQSINESVTACNITVTNAPTTWKLTEGQCALTSVVVSNETGGHTFTLNTDYNLFAQTGIIQMLNTSDTSEGFSNTTLVDYSYCADGYNTDSGARGIARLIGLFAIIALFIWVAVRSEILDMGTLIGR